MFALVISFYPFTFNLYIYIFFILSFFLYFIYLVSFGYVGSSFLCEGFLQLRRVGATLHCSAQASHCRGLSCCGAQAPDAQAQQLWLTGPVALRHVGSSQTRARTRAPALPGRFSTTVPPGKPQLIYFYVQNMFLKTKLQLIFVFLIHSEKLSFVISILSIFTFNIIIDICNSLDYVFSVSVFSFFLCSFFLAYFWVK